MNEEAINNLCEQFGTTASMLMTEVAKMKTAEVALTVGVCYALLVFGLFLVIKGLKMRPKELSSDDNDGWIAVITVGVAVVLFFGSFSIYNSVEMVGWIVSPTAKSLLFITRNIR